MRLTLRTLLAYLDDVLEPSETKLIGQKIQESAVAGKLISLIRLVVRQRRLKAPSVSGPNIGIDPNVVSQYLDNTLPPEQVVEVEKVLLTSDELLAEVASCHQVLALVMGKPVEVSEASRERLYALGPVGKSEQLRVEDATHVESPLIAAAARDAERVNGSIRPVTTPAAPEVPEYLRQSSWSQRIVPTAVMSLLVLVCVGLLYLDPSLLPGLRQAKRELAKVDSRPAASSAVDPEQSTATRESHSMTSTEAPQVVAHNSDSDRGGQTRAAEIPPGPSLTLPLDPTAPADAPEQPAVAKIKPAVPTPARNGAGAPVDASAVVKGSTVPPSPTGPIPNPPPTVDADDLPSVRNPLAVQYASNEGVVLRWDEPQQHWFQLPKKSAVSPGEMLAVPEPFEAVLDFERGLIVGTILGDSAVRVLDPNRIAGSGLNIHRGRLLLRTMHKDLPTNCCLSIVVGSDAWTLEFLAPDTLCTIEISPREPIQFEKGFDQNWYVGILRVVSGSVKWTSGDGQSQQIGAQKALEIVPFKATSGARPAPVTYEYIPEWTDAQKRKQAPQHRKAVSLFEKEFELDQSIEQTLLTLIRHRDARVSELAVRCLGLIEVPAALVQALAECDFEEGRFAAREGIRTWLGRQSDRGPLLKTALELHFPIPEANAAYVMLWGFRPEDGSNRATSVELVLWLRSSHVAIRELAYYWVTQLSNRKWEYRAMDVQARRDAAVRKIETHINKDGALVKPTGKDSPPSPKPE